MVGMWFWNKVTNLTTPWNQPALHTDMAYLGDEPPAPASPGDTNRSRAPEGIYHHISFTTQTNTNKLTCSLYQSTLMNYCQWTVWQQSEIPKEGLVSTLRFRVNKQTNKHTFEQTNKHMHKHTHATSMHTVSMLCPLHPYRWAGAANPYKVSSSFQLHAPCVLVHYWTRVTRSI